MYTHMTTTIRKWGNSLGLRIPRDIAKDVGLNEGKEVTIKKHGVELVIRPLKKRHIDIDAMIRKITPDNRHALIDWGPPRGKEIW